MKSVPDPRRIKSVDYPLPFLLLCSILAILSGSQSLLNIQKFALRHYVQISEALNISVLEKAPSYNVFRNAFIKLKLNDFETLFNLLFQSNECELIHLDGKASKGSIKDSNNSKQSFLMTVSAYSSELNQTMKRWSFDSKEKSEIKEIRELIRELEGIKTITADSVHCNKETINLLESKKHKYLIQFKGNQRKLKKTALWIEENEKAFSEDETKELNRGRREKRKTKVFRFQSSDWKGSKAIIIQERWRNKSNEKAFYLSNGLLNANKAAKAIRKHWSIESMHWEKDELMGEDKNKTKNHNIAGILSCLRTISLNIAKSSAIESFTNFKQSYAHDILALLALFYSCKIPHPEKPRLLYPFIKARIGS